jgi:hypothetical protein
VNVSCHVQAQDPSQSSQEYHYVISVSMPVLDIGENKVIAIALSGLYISCCEVQSLVCSRDFLACCGPYRTYVCVPLLCIMQ